MCKQVITIRYQKWYRLCSGSYSSTKMELLTPLGTKARKGFNGLSEDIKFDMGFEGEVGTHQEKKEIRAVEIKMPCCQCGEAKK